MTVLHNPSDTIPSVNLEEIERIKAIFYKYIDRNLIDSYTLEVDPEKTILVGISGGADSSVLAMFVAIFMKPTNPNMVFIFTDTKDEPLSAYDTIAKIESVTGIKVQRVEHPLGLYGLIDKYNNYLPSSKARYCTRQLKVEPMAEFVKPYAEKGFVNLAGIRFDEADREGLTFAYEMEQGRSAFPFVDLKVDRNTVFSILDETIGIPVTYAYRSRSGCKSCFHLRNIEHIGTLNHDPVSYLKTESYEKLSENDLDRWNDIPSVLTEIGCHPNYPIPRFIDYRDKTKFPQKRPKAITIGHKTNNELDLFSDSIDEFDDLFVGFALYTEPSLMNYKSPEFTPGVYWQEFLTFSTSYNGLQSQLGNYYQFRSTTPMPQYDVSDLNIVIIQLRFKKGVLDLGKPNKGFMWKSSQSLKQLRHTTRHIQSSLERHALTQERVEAVNLMREADVLEDAVQASERVLKVSNTLKLYKDGEGEIVWEGLYKPSKAKENQVQMQLEGVSSSSEFKPAREGFEFDEVPRSCVVCSI